MFTVLFFLDPGQLSRPSGSVEAAIQEAEAIARRQDVRKKR